MLLWLIDPAQVYFDRQRRHSRPHGVGQPSHRKASVRGCDVTTKSRPVTQVEFAAIRRRSDRLSGEHHAGLADARQRWALAVAPSGRRTVQGRGHPHGARRQDRRRPHHRLVARRPATGNRHRRIDRRRHVAVTSAPRPTLRRRRACRVPLQNSNEKLSPPHVPQPSQHRCSLSELHGPSTTPARYTRSLQRPGQARQCSNQAAKAGV